MKRSGSFLVLRFGEFSHFTPPPKRTLGQMSSDAVQAYAREGAAHGKQSESEHSSRNSGRI
ncbi:hypothetical protein RISK_005106 [Rhodopirellula islandica]|uniref:Uncharacterized protein n=1 Tax=Rhodopirellula islandica TaxID=595434 RepID=A0A0J1B7J6_RHOIS|nr:hypothetical protein RISK_005106 [Rhodopirellula islandica]